VKYKKVTIRLLKILRKFRARHGIKRMRNATGHGGITWTRDELYRY